MTRVHKSISLILCIGFTIALSNCFDMGTTYSKLPPGPWRGVLKLDPDLALHQKLKRETSRSQLLIIDEVTEAQLPFNFDVVYDSDEKFHLEIHNADENILVNDIYYGFDQATGKDTIRAFFDAYDSYLNLVFDSNVMEGEWVVPSRGDYRVGFVAHHGKSHRFTDLKKPPMMDVSGSWEVMFGPETDEPYAAIGEFEQDGNHLIGTFLTETGDYRFLEGTVQANKLYLSCFDGAHMFLFEGKIGDDSTISGLFRSGTHYITSWTGKRNEDFALKNPDSLTYMVKDETIDFSFPDEKGNLISLHDAEFEGKSKLIQITGTWCPNCLDETKFLIDFLGKNTYDEDLAVISLAFERHKDPLVARSNIARYRQKLHIPYPVLHAGPADKKAAAKQLPMLNHLLSYPTLIFLNRKNEVVRIHTGFNGPATSLYESFESEFKETIEEITTPI